MFASADSIEIRISDKRGSCRTWSKVWRTSEKTTCGDGRKLCLMASERQTARMWCRTTTTNEWMKNVSKSDNQSRKKDWKSQVWLAISRERMANEKRWNLEKADKKKEKKKKNWKTNKQSTLVKWSWICVERNKLNSVQLNCKIVFGRARINRIK